jgi:hypothetical protein
MRIQAALTLTLALSSCPQRETATVRVTAVSFPAVVQPSAVGLPLVLKDSCFASEAGGKCVSDEAEALLADFGPADRSLTRNASGDVLIGAPFRFVHASGNASGCGPLPMHPVVGRQWFLEQAWLAEDSVRVVAAADTATEDSTWLSNDGCRTWEQLAIEGFSLGARIFENEVWTITARSTGLWASRTELSSGGTVETPLPVDTRFVSLNANGVLAFGRDVTAVRFTPTLTSTVLSSASGLLAGCGAGPMVALSKSGDACSVRSVPRSGEPTSGATVPLHCDTVPTFGVCRGERLFLDFAGVLVEALEEGFVPARSRSMSTPSVNAVLSSAGIRLYTAEAKSAAVVRTRWTEDGWRLEGIGTERSPDEIDHLAIGQNAARLEFSFIGGGPRVGYQLSDASDAGVLASFPTPFDTGIRRLPPFHAVNARTETLVFPGADCKVVSAGRDGSTLEAVSCVASLASRYPASIVADPDVSGRWITRDLSGGRNSILVEEFGDSFAELSGPGVFVFDVEGDPLALADAREAIALPGRRGYVVERTGDVLLHLFEGRDTVWRGARIVSAAGSRILLRTNDEFLIVLVE